MRGINGLALVAIGILHSLALLLLVFAVFAIVLDTDTGFWLVLFVAVSMIVAAKRGPEASERP